MPVQAQRFISEMFMLLKQRKVSINLFRRPRRNKMTDTTETVNMEDWKSEKEHDAFLDRCIEETATGNMEGFKKLYTETKSSVYGFALSILKNPDDAEDVLQDCYVKVHSAAGDYKSQGKPMAWILTITKNLCLQLIRDKKKQADIPEEDWEKYIGENDAVSAEDNIVLTEILQTLSEDERQIVVLHAVSGLKHREIADFMKIPLSTVLSKYNRSLKKLNTKLTKGEGYDR